jgi:hypothetical protein
MITSGHSASVARQSAESTPIVDRSGRVGRAVLELAGKNRKRALSVGHKKAMLDSGLALFPHPWRSSPRMFVMLFIAAFLTV